MIPKDVRGIFRFRGEPVDVAYTRPVLGLPLGPLRFRTDLVLGERRPRESLSILVDGILQTP